jgi:hypothetical protein
MSDLDEMRRLLAHIKARHKLSNQAKVDVYKRHVAELVSEASGGLRLRSELLPLTKVLQGFIGELAQHRLPVIGAMVELAYKGGGFGRTTSAFDNWFQSQFGPPPFSDAIKLEAARDEVRQLEAELGEKKRRLERHEKYTEHERAALYAWQARGSGSPKTIVKARPRPRGRR